MNCKVNTEWTRETFSHGLYQAAYCTKWNVRCKQTNEKK